MMAWFYLSGCYYYGTLVFVLRVSVETVSLDNKIKEIIMDTWFQIRLEVTLDGT